MITISIILFYDWIWFVKGWIWSLKGRISCIKAVSHEIKWIYNIKKKHPQNETYCCLAIKMIVDIIDGWKMGIKIFKDFRKKGKRYNGSNGKYLWTRLVKDWPISIGIEKNLDDFLGQF